MVKYSCNSSKNIELTFYNEISKEYERESKRKLKTTATTSNQDIMTKNCVAWSLMLVFAQYGAKHNRESEILMVSLLRNQNGNYPFRFCTKSSNSWKLSQSV
jgi:hypothetical protein